MCTKRKSKWFPLISIGVLMVVLPYLIEDLSSWHITELFKYVLMVGGISIELIGLILIGIDVRQLKKTKTINIKYKMIMKRLKITSIITLVIGIICILLWRFVLPAPSDWFVRIPGLIMIISIFTFVYSSQKLKR
ncbi:MAG: hypothetical protein IH595_04345 [Bacteroidales bacterium]|nr:hypothetical protein [Bacteroidales bacterium]